MGTPNDPDERCQAAQYTEVNKCDSAATTCRSSIGSCYEARFDSTWCTSSYAFYDSAMMMGDRECVYNEMGTADDPDERCQPAQYTEVNMCSAGNARRLDASGSRGNLRRGPGRRWS